MMNNDWFMDYASHRVRLIALEQEWLEIRYWHLFDEQERRGWITKNGRHILIGEDSGGGGKSWESVDKSGGSGIISTDRKMSASIQDPPDFSKYPVTDDPDSVKAIKTTISESLGIAEQDIDLNGIRNTEVLEPFVKRLQKIQADTGMKFPKIKTTEVIAGDELCIASYQPIEHTFYISSRYFNSKDALTDTLKNWAGNDILPKQAKSIAYLAEHESAHMRIPDSLLETKEAMKLWKKRKLVNKNDADIYEYFADATAIYRMNPNDADSGIVKAVEYLRKGGVTV